MTQTPAPAPETSLEPLNRGGQPADPSRRVFLQRVGLTALFGALFGTSLLKKCGRDASMDLLPVPELDEATVDQFLRLVKEAEEAGKKGDRQTMRDKVAEYNQILKTKIAPPLQQYVEGLNGKYEIRVRGIPIGLGSHVHYKRKLDGRIAQALMSMQSVKAVEFGLGTLLAEVPGSEAHDEIFYDSKRGYYYKTNRAGGVTGGMTNGAEISVCATMKPISTLRRELRSVNMKTKKEEKADFERSDVCAVPAGSVIGEAIVAYEVADALLEKFGGDSIRETKRNYEGYLDQLAKS